MLCSSRLLAEREDITYHECFHHIARQTSRMPTYSQSTLTAENPVNTAIEMKVFLFKRLKH
jgi:hypothetical protein